MSVRRFQRAGFTLIELLVVIAIIGVLIGLLLPAVQSVRAAARRCQCTNNLMQMSIAVQNYESSFEMLPPGVVNQSGPIANKPPGYHYSWMVQILPYIEQKSVYNHLNFMVGVYEAANATSRAVEIATFLCPADHSPNADDLVMLNNYAANHHDVEAPIAADNKGVFFLNSSVRLEDLEDGASNTIFIGEKRRGQLNDLGWGSGTKATLRNGGTTINAAVTATKANPDPVGGYGSLHPGGAEFAFGDGSVRFLTDRMPLTTLKSLSNRSDGELITPEGN